jgi:hypothetical protein
VPAGKVEALCRQAATVGVAISEIGAVAAGEGTRLLGPGGTPLVLAHPSFSHF